MSSKNELNLLGQGSYGCVYRPGIKCDGKKTTQSYITKVQQEESATQNEIDIGKKIMKIPNYSKYFSPIIETCPLDISHIDEKELNSCMLYDKQTKFISNKMKYVGKNTLYSAMSLLINEYPKLFIRLIVNSTMDLLKQFQLLNDHHIVHMDVKQDNIVLKDKTNKPVLIDYGLSFDVTDFKADHVFFIYGYDYVPWCIDITVISYMVNNKGTAMTEWKDTQFTKKDVDIVINDFQQYNPIMSEFMKNVQVVYEYKNQCIEYLNGFVGKRCKELYSELMKNYVTWDIYALCAMYYRIIHHYHLENELEPFISLLEKQIYAHPKERKNGKEMRKQLKELYNLTSLKESKKKISKKLKTINEKEKEKINKNVTTEHVKEMKGSKKHYEEYMKRVSK